MNRWGKVRRLNILPLPLIIIHRMRERITEIVMICKKCVNWSTRLYIRLLLRIGVFLVWGSPDLLQERACARAPEDMSVIFILLHR